MFSLSPWQSIIVSLMFMEKKLEDVFLAFGGNIGDAASTIRQAKSSVQALDGVEQVSFSRLYRTSPVSSIAQADYVNAVCMLKTALLPGELWGKIQAIERELGKEKKAKDAPRVIDIDILFFGDIQMNEEGLEIPHPRWQDRLFVLVPLFDLVPHIDSLHIGTVDIKKRIEELSRQRRDTVELYEEESYAK